MIVKYIGSEICEKCDVQTATWCRRTIAGPQYICDDCRKKEKK